MAIGHAALCQKPDTTGNRFVMHIKKNRHKIKTVYANVGGKISGTIDKDSLLRLGKVNMVDLQKKLKNIRVVSFDLVAERRNNAGNWYPIKKAHIFSLYSGNEFTDEMKGIIKSCYKGDRIELFVTGIYYDGMRYGSIQGIGYGAHVCLCMQ